MEVDDGGGIQVMRMMMADLPTAITLEMVQGRPHLQEAEGGGAGRGQDRR